MRFTRFSLEKYGVFDRREVSVARDAGLSVIYGPNEAGKSTFLSAVSDFLYGIPAQTQFGSVYGYDSMRLEASLQLADGSELRLQRRKGNRTTLRAEDGRQVDEAVLAAVLCGTSRQRFATLFGLDHESLRAGGDRLLAAEGDIGRLIVEAGGGLRALVERVERLEEQIDLLFSKQRAGRRAFYKAFDAIKDAETTIKATLVTREAFAQAEAHLASAKDVYDRLRSEGKDVARRKASVERLKRVAPLIRQLRREEEKLQTLDDLPTLSTDFEQQVSAAIDRVENAGNGVDHAAEHHRKLEASLADVVVDERWFGLRASIDDAVGKAVLVKQEHDDTPNRLKDLAESEGRLARLQQLIGAAGIAELERRAPTAAELDQFQQLRTEGATRRASLVGKRESLRKRTFDLGALEARLEEAKSNGFAVALAMRSDDFASLARDRARLGRLRRNADESQKKLEAAAARLGLASIAALGALDAPGLDAIQTVTQDLTNLRNQREREAERVRSALTAIDTAKREIERLARSGEVPTESAVKAARASRDAAFAPVRSSYVEGRRDGTKDMRAKEIQLLDEAIDRADRLVDRRSAEGQRIASMEQQQRAREEAEAEKSRSEAEVERLDARHIEASRTFSDRYSQATALEPDLQRLKSFTEDRRKLLESATKLEAERATVDPERADLDARMKALADAEAKLGLAQSAEEDLEARALSVVQAIEAHNRSHAEYSHDLRDAQDARSEIARLSHDVKELEEEDAVWLGKWQSAVAALGLETEVSLQRAESVALEWATALSEFRNLAQTRRRLQRFAENEQGLANTVTRLKASLDLELENDPAAAVGQIAELAKDNEAARITRANLEPRVAEAARELDAARDEAADASTALAKLRALAGVDDTQGLEFIAGKNSHRHGLVLAIAERRQSISTAGDGFAVEELIAELAERDTDALSAELAEIAADEARCEDDLRSSIERRQQAQLALDEFEAGEGVGPAQALRESAASELRAVVEQWLELSLARDLIKDALVTVRAEQQDPLINRAGALFRLATRGAFEGVAADLDAKGQPVVVGRRPDNSEVRVAELSDGTRDQLFLSFRLASLERYAEVAEPLPFVADDVLVHFDDQRAEATLELLSTFGQTNQVLLFTHHRSVRDAARRLGEKAKVEVLDLAS